MRSGQRMGNHSADWTQSDEKVNLLIIKNVDELIGKQKEGIYETKYQ